MGNIDFFYLRCIKCMKRRHKLDTFVFLDMSDQILITGAKVIDLYKYCTYFEFHGHILVSIVLRRLPDGKVACVRCLDSKPNYVQFCLPLIQWCRFG